MTIPRQIIPNTSDGKKNIEQDRILCNYDKQYFMSLLIKKWSKKIFHSFFYTNELLIFIEEKYLTKLQKTSLLSLSF